MNIETADDRWRAVVDRDGGRDGEFVYGVLTTGVYCRPSCKSRQPLRRNVVFFDRISDAERAGLRPCKRCRPGESGAADTDRIGRVCRFIEENCDAPLPLADLARLAGLSPFHLQRLFRRTSGVSPKEYQEACRLRRFKSGLRERGDVTEAVYDAGYGSSSRAYEGVALGMTPGEYRNGGEHVAISYAAMNTRFGLLMIGATSRGVCFVQFGESEEDLKKALRAEYPAAQCVPSDPPRGELSQWREALHVALEGSTPDASLPLDIRATAFQKRVWEYLRSIPRGQTRSYAEVAEAIGKPSAVRAVARACASNTVAVLIPCHRVIRADGSLGGYRWGEDRKEAILATEAG